MLTFTAVEIVLELMNCSNKRGAKKNNVEKAI